VEIKTRADTSDISALQRAADFVQAFILGFDIGDAIALLRLDDLYVESFEVRAGPFEYIVDQLRWGIVCSGFTSYLDMSGTFQYSQQKAETGLDSPWVLNKGTCMAVKRTEQETENRVESPDL
jgi:hypothetical protein